MNIKEKIKDYKIVIPLGILMGVLVLALTGLFYGLFACKLIAGHEAMTEEIRSLIAADSINVVTIIIANILYGYLLVLIFKWAKIYNPLFGGIAGTLIAVLSDLYYALALYSNTKNMFTITSISIDALTYAVVNFIAGAFLAWFLAKHAKKKNEQIA